MKNNLNTIERIEIEGINDLEIVSWKLINGNKHKNIELRLDELNSIFFISCYNAIYSIIKNSINRTKGLKFPP